MVQSDGNGCATWRLQGIDGMEKEVRVRGRFSSNAQEVLRKAACEGFGIVAPSSILAATDFAAGRLVRVLPDYKRAGRDLSVV